MDKQERHRNEILNALSRSTRPVTSSRLAHDLQVAGYQLSERSIRLYLKQMEEEGLTKSLGRKGRLITEQGVAAFRASQIMERAGYLSAKIDQMTYKMTFDLASRTGDVLVNTSIVTPRQLSNHLEGVCKVFADGYAMGNRLALLGPGETLGGVVVPADRVGFCTVCSITINGVLLKHGIPTTSRFGGLLEMRNGRPTRFVEMIHYDGTSIDPLEVFIRGGMTDYCGAIRDGNGLIGASFREMPEDSRDLVVSIGERLSTIGLGAILEVGLPGQPVLGIPVSRGRIGAVFIGGLNPIAILEELGDRVYSRALSGLMEYTQLVPYPELQGLLSQYI